MTALLHHSASPVDSASLGPEPIFWLKTTPPACSDGVNMRILHLEDPLVRSLREDYVRRSPHRRLTRVQVVALGTAAAGGHDW